MLPLPKYEFVSELIYISTIELLYESHASTAYKEKKVIYSKVLLVYSIIIERRNMD